MASKINSKGRSVRKLGLENLERRELMAGDVGVYVSGGSLYVNGDNASNGLNITQVAPGTFDVAGAYTGGGATRVNGYYSPLRFYGVTDDVKITMNGGHDSVTLGGSSEATRDVLPDDLVVNMGDGDDYFRAQYLSNRDYNDRMTVNTGWGNDQVSMYKVVCRDWMSIDTAQNWDTVDLTNVTVGTKLSMYGGAGNDTMRINLSVVDQIYADMGTEDDTVSVRNSVIRTGSSIHGGAGYDTLNQYGNNRWVGYSGMDRYSYNNY